MTPKELKIIIDILIEDGKGEYKLFTDITNDISSGFGHRLELLEHNAVVIDDKTKTILLS